MKTWKAYVIKTKNGVGFKNYTVPIDSKIRFSPNILDTLFLRPDSIKETNLFPDEVLVEIKIKEVKKVAKGSKKK